MRNGERICRRNGRHSNNGKTTSPQSPSWPIATVSPRRFSTPSAACRLRKWERLLSTFSDLIAFSKWMELILDLEGLNSRLVSDEIGTRYQGFSFSSAEIASGEAILELNFWVIEREIGVKRENLLAAIVWHVQHHPAYYAISNYVMHCHEAWPE